MSDHPSQPAHPATATAAAEPGRLPRLLALTAVSVGVLVLAAAAFLFSYPGIHAIALHAGVSASLARGYPVIFDAMLVIAFAAVLSLRGAGLISRCYAWLSLIVLLAAVAGAGAAHSARVVIPHRPAAVTAAILPWALLLIGFGLLVAMLRHARVSRARARAAAARAAADQAAAAEQIPEPRRPAGPPIAALPPGSLPPGPPAPGPLTPAAPALPQRIPGTSTPAVGTPALGTPALGTPVPGTPGLGSSAPGSPALETPALGLPALGAASLGTASLGTAAEVTPGPGKPTLGYPGPATVLPGPAAGSATPMPGGAPLVAPAALQPLPQIPSGHPGPAQPANAIADRVVAPTRGRHAGGPASAGPDGSNGVPAAVPSTGLQTAAQQTAGSQAAGQQASGHEASGEQAGPAGDGPAGDGPAGADRGMSAGADRGVIAGSEDSQAGLPKRVPAATLGDNGDGGGGLTRRATVRIEDNPVTAPAASQGAQVSQTPHEARQSAATGTEPGQAAPPAFHRMWSSPTPPGEETD